MRPAWTLLAVAVVVVLVAFGVYVYAPAPQAPSLAAPPVTPALIARGKYVATAADCMACHTVPGGVPFAGGRPFKLPFGAIYSPNITPDRQTGIGAWSDGEFLRALHQGVGRDGRELYPAFPYTSYAGMTRDDALALKAYLFTLPAVHAPPHPNSLAFPFDQRPLMRLWKLLFLPRQAERPDSQAPAEWKRGAYLVTVLGHCGECHTPRNLLYGMDKGRALAGQTIQGWTAWNITSDPRHGLGAWSVDEIMAYLRYGYAPGRGAANGPMKEAVDDSLSGLTPEDLHAIAIYLKATRPIASGPPSGVLADAARRSSLVAPAPDEPGAGGQGRRIFEGACASCHAWNGRGAETPIADLQGLPSVADPRGVNVVQTVLHGSSVSAPRGSAFMPAFGRAYSDAEVAAVSNYVVQHFGGRPGRVTAKAVAEARRQ